MQANGSSVTCAEQFSWEAQSNSAVKHYVFCSQNKMIVYKWLGVFLYKILKGLSYWDTIKMVSCKKKLKLSECVLEKFECAEDCVGVYAVDGPHRS